MPEQTGSGVVWETMDDSKKEIGCRPSVPVFYRGSGVGGVIMNTKTQLASGELNSAYGSDIRTRAEIAEAP